MDSASRRQEPGCNGSGNKVRVGSLALTQPCVPQHPISSREVLEADQDSLHLCLLGLGLWLQDLERGLGPCVSAQSRMVQLQVGKGLRSGGQLPLEMDLFHVPHVWMGRGWG